MKRMTVLIAALAVLAAGLARAQEPPGDPGNPPQPPRRPLGLQPPSASGAPGQPEEDRLGQNFYPPELVMHNQAAIGLTEEQRETIISDMAKTTARFTELQWKQTAAAEAMETLIKQAKVDEKAALAQLDKLLATESEIKHLHLGLMIRVKNVLTSEQQTKLDALKRSGRMMGPGPQRGPGPMPGRGRPTGPPPGAPGE